MPVRCVDMPVTSFTVTENLSTGKSSCVEVAKHKELLLYEMSGLLGGPAKSKGCVTSVPGILHADNHGALMSSWNYTTCFLPAIITMYEDSTVLTKQSSEQGAVEHRK